MCYSTFHLKIFEPVILLFTTTPLPFNDTTILAFCCDPTSIPSCHWHYLSLPCDYVRIFALCRDLSMMPLSSSAMLWNLSNESEIIWGNFFLWRKNQNSRIILKQRQSNLKEIWLGHTQSELNGSPITQI